MKITATSRVSFNFALELMDGQVVDSNLGKAAVSFVMGDQSLLAGFEQALLGSQKGDKINVVIPPENAFGQPNPQNKQEFDRAHFIDMALEPGLMISFKDAANTELPGVVERLDGDKVIIDFNHPLAGKSLRFIAEIHDVNEA